MNAKQLIDQLLNESLPSSISSKDIDSFDLAEKQLRDVENFMVKIERTFPTYKSKVEKIRKDLYSVIIDWNVLGDIFKKESK